MKRFRGGLVFKAHRLCVSLNSELESNKEEDDYTNAVIWRGWVGGTTPSDVVGFRSIPLRTKSAAHRDKDREWACLKPRAEPLSTVGKSGRPFTRGIGKVFGERFEASLLHVIS